jgi:hypothetical protein
MYDLSEERLLLRREVMRAVYEIIGIDRRYGMKQSYGRFKTLKDCLTHMDFLMRSFGSTTKFKCVEVINHHE